MDWLINTLRVIREVRDWPATRGRPPLPRAPKTEATETHTNLVAPLGPVAVEAPPPPRPEPKKKRPEPAPPERRTPEITLEQVDPAALSAVRRLHRSGYKAYLVGGCVRDLLLGLEPKDFDIATDARPEEVRSIFRNSRIIGRRFRLVHLYFRDGHIIEVSTFRAGITQDDDSDTEEDLLIRRDNTFGTEEEDARRRDFTINGLFYDVASGRIIDHVGGLADVRQRYLRMIGDPDIRLREDPVRILRAVRFTAKVGLRLDPELRRGISAHKDELTRCAPARVLEETLRLLRIGHAQKTVRLLDELGVLSVILPELHTFLDGEDATPRAEALYAHLAALDHLIAREPVADAVVFAALYSAPVEAHVARRAADGMERTLATQELLAQVGTRISLTRKLGEQLRLLYQTQRHFGRPKDPKKRRKSSLAGLSRRSFFLDALQLHEIQARANGLPLDEVREGYQLLGHVPAELQNATSETVAPPADDDDLKPRRRRRRR